MCLFLQVYSTQISFLCTEYWVFFRWGVSWEEREADHSSPHTGQVSNKYRRAFMACKGAICLNRLTPDDPYMGRIAPLTSKHCILYIYSTNIDTEYFKHVLYSPFFSLQNAVCFIMLTCLVLVLFTFYIQNVLKLKK